MKLSEKMAGNKVISAIRRFMMSKTFMIILFIIAAVFIVLRGKGSIMPLVYGDVTLAMILCLVLVICDDIIATLFPFLLICSISIKCYDSFDIFIKFVYLAPIVLFSLLFHFIVYRRKIEIGSTWKGIAAVAVAVTIGGLGKITAAEYFKPTALFYTFGLGIGMLLVYFILNTYYREEGENYTLRFHFSFIMTMVGLFCVFIMIHHYIIYWTNFMAKLSPLFVQWRNNISTIFMLTMPFAFYLSSRKYPYIFAGVAQYIAILFTGSRGGALGGTVEFGLCLIVLIYCDIKHRKRNLIFIACTVIAALTFFLEPIMKFFTPVLLRLFDGDDIREGLISRAVEDFKSNIIFGRGLGYNGNTDVHDPKKFAICWYHSSPFQVIGSFGLVGVAAFTYQLYNRMKLVWSRITQFNLTLFVSYAGLFLMSLVNPGEFCPIPYGMLAVLFFIICEKNNAAASKRSSIAKEDIIKIQF